MPDAGGAAWLISVPWALLLVAAALLLAAPLSDLLYPAEPPLTLLPGDPGRLTPEPLEGTRYLLAVGGALLLAAATFVAARPGPSRLRPRTTTILVVAAQVLLLILVAACFADQHAARWEVSYFTVATLGVAAAIAAGVAVAVLVDRPLERVRRWGDSRRTRRLVGVAMLLATAAWLLPGVNSERSIVAAFPAIYHDTAFHFDETFAVLNGLTPLADFNAQYASLFPYAIAASMMIFGKTLLVFTISVCTLSALALLAIYGVLRRASGSPLAAALLFVPFLATSLFDPFGLSVARFGPGVYFAVMPFRYGGPYLLAWLVARQLDRPREERLWLLFLAAGLVVLNNFEFGVPALGATGAALLVTRTLDRRALLRLLGAVALGLGAAVAAVSVVTLVRAGSFPDLARMPQFARLYGVAGYSVAPMPGLLGFPLVIYLTYVAAIGTATVRAIDGASNRVLTGMLAWSGLFGLGAASYYVARSAWTLMPMIFSAWALAIALLTVAAVEALRARRSRRSSLAALAVFFGIGLAACSIAQAPAPWREIRRIETPPAASAPGPDRWAAAPSRTAAVRSFVSATVDRAGHAVVRRGAPVAIFLTTGHRIADAYGVVDVVPFTGPESMHTSEQLTAALDALRDAGGTTLLLPLERVPALHVPLERRGFRILGRQGVHAAPIDERALAEAMVVDGLTKWVDTTDLTAG